MLIVGVPCPMANDWFAPVAAAQFVVAVACATSVHVPTAR